MAGSIFCLFVRFTSSVAGRSGYLIVLCGIQVVIVIDGQVLPASTIRPMKLRLLILILAVRILGPQASFIVGLVTPSAVWYTS